jgi:NDP-sugar pyrophosphorylase family protein
MRAMILAAGYGTRLWPLTIDRAKPAIPFMGRPLVGYVAEYLGRYGFDDVVVNLHHRPESVRAALGDGSRFGVRLHYVEEPVILGTSGAIENARALLDGDAFVVINGKLATDIDLAAALATHRRTDALATLVLRPNPLRERYSVVHTSGGLVTGFGGFPESDKAGGAPGAAQEEQGTVKRESAGDFAGVAGGVGVVSDDVASAAGAAGGAESDVPLMFTGIQVFAPRVFEYIPRGVFSHSVTDVFLPAIARGERIAAHVAEGAWHELSTVQRYLDTSVELMRGEGREVELGEGSVVEPGAEVSESVLWENVTVRRGARVRRAVLGAGVVVPEGETYEEVAVVRAELAASEERPEKGLAGEVRGPNFVAPLPR